MHGYTLSLVLLGQPNDQISRSKNVFGLMKEKRWSLSIIMTHPRVGDNSYFKSSLTHCYWSKVINSARKVAVEEGLNYGLVGVILYVIPCN